MSPKVVPFKSLVVVSYSPSVVTMAVSVALTTDTAIVTIEGE